MNTTTKWVITIIAIIAILAGIQWWQTSRNIEDIDASQQVSSSQTTSAQPVTAPSSDQSATTTNSNQTSMNPSTKNFGHTITIVTNKGTIVFETYDADAPKTVANFITLAEKGFYNNLIFHRVIKDFMIQGGDPTGTGMGGPGYKFADELNPNTVSYKTGYVRGTVAMANSGPNTNGSQFFIMHEDNQLPHLYTIFGKVTQGLDVVDAIAHTPTNSSDRPLQDVVMEKVTVTENK